MPSVIHPRQIERSQEATLRTLDSQRKFNTAQEKAFEVQKSAFLDETKAELEPELRAAIPATDHLQVYGSRTFIGFPGAGEGKMARRCRLARERQ